MRKRFTSTLVLLLVVSLMLAACTTPGANEQDPGESQSATVASIIDGEEIPAPFSPEVSSPPDENTDETTTNTQEAEITPQESEAIPLPSSTLVSSENVLVAYFSCTGNTEDLAASIAEELSATLYPIQPETAYTDEDLNYSDANSRSVLEMNDPSARPAIAGSVADIDRYDTVFLAYPIWFGEVPRIINTFLESYDFTGKTIVPLCTSGSSDIGSSDINLHGLTSEATTWVPGRRFATGDGRDALVDWLASLPVENLQP